ncbi:hypothetical protein [Ekhidna sp.]
MKTQYIKLLKKQVGKLEEDSFELEAWKTSSITVIERIFGKEDIRAKKIEELKIDYSSWALRDSNSNYKPVEIAKLKGKEILTTAIDEIELFGAPENQTMDVLGKDFAKKLQNMNSQERKKHFTEMKKGELVDLLIRLLE